MKTTCSPRRLGKPKCLRFGASRQYNLPALRAANLQSSGCASLTQPTPAARQEISDRHSCLSLKTNLEGMSGAYYTDAPPSPQPSPGGRGRKPAFPRPDSGLAGRTQSFNARVAEVCRARPGFDTSAVQITRLAVSEANPNVTAVLFNRSMYSQAPNVGVRYAHRQPAAYDFRVCNSPVFHANSPFRSAE